MPRYLPALALVVVLAGCGPAPSNGHRKPTPSPTPTVTPGVLHVVHTPGTLVDDQHLHAGQCHAVGALPDPTCTPGAIDPAVTQANIKTTICVRGYTSTIRPPLSLTGPAKRASAVQYGVTVAAGEYDHLVPLELGGASATSNLWVEASPGGKIPNAKDGVESTLRAAVCAGRLALATAQQEIARNWQTAK